MSAERIQNFVTPDEYLELDHAAEIRSEYFSGEMVAMSGASDSHELIVYNICGELRERLRGKLCTGRPSNLRVRVNSTNYVYPDATVTCGKMTFADDTNASTLINPTVIFEVLSDSTEHIDRGLKWKLYQQIESLRHYVLVDQQSPRVEIYTRQNETDWLMHAETGLQGSVSLQAIDITLPMSGIYEDLIFPSDAN